MRPLGRIAFHLFGLLMVAYFTLPMVVAVLMSFTPFAVPAHADDRVVGDWSFCFTNC